ncbi:MAG: ATP-binding protein [Bacteroides sp.]|nr:ATP-binding protein [Bacteroides sp.]
MSDDKETIIGKVSATERNPSTIDSFYFWTKSNCKLGPFDVIKVAHFDESTTYGQIEEISHVTDSASHLSSFISSDFGNTHAEADGNTDRLAFNYVKAKVIGNTKNIYTPVQHGQLVEKCSIPDIQVALGLKGVNNPLRCGYLEMYKERVPVDINANFIVGPDGAHLNISGISGLASKTSYCMFLLNALQQKYMHSDDEPEKTVAFVIFNVKGQDLLSIDVPAHMDKKTLEKYEILEVQPIPFQNVRYFYPYSDSASDHNIQSFGNWDETISIQEITNKMSRFKYTCKSCLDKLEYLFAGEEDATGTMDSIITHIANERPPFEHVKTWSTFQQQLKSVLKDKGSTSGSGIALSSWKKFNRIIEKVLSDKVFADNICEEKNEVVLADSLNQIKPNEVFVIDIAKLDEKSQAFVFGDVMETLHEMMSAKKIAGMPDKIVVFVDELNKYASTDIPKSSPILKQLLEITERGRSLGLILFSVEQFRSAIHDRIKGNCATSAYGRTNFVEVGKPDYRYLGDTYRNIMTRLPQGEYIISNPALRSLIHIHFPKPPYKENK